MLYFFLLFVFFLGIDFSSLHNEIDSSALSIPSEEERAIQTRKQLAEKTKVKKKTTKQWRKTITIKSMTKNQQEKQSF